MSLSPQHYILPKSLNYVVLHNTVLLFVQQRISLGLGASVFCREVAVCGFEQQTGKEGNEKGGAESGEIETDSVSSLLR